MKKTMLIVTAACIILSIVGVLSYGIFLRPKTIYVDSSSWSVSGPSSLNAVSVKAYRKSEPEDSRPANGTTVGVLFLQNNGHTSLNIAPHPRDTGTRFILDKNPQILEAQCSKGVDWVYEVSFN